MAKRPIYKLRQTASDRFEQQLKQRAVMYQVELTPQVRNLVMMAWCEGAFWGEGAMERKWRSDTVKPDHRE